MVNQYNDSSAIPGHGLKQPSGGPKGFFFLPCGQANATRLPDLTDCGGARSAVWRLASGVLLLVAGGRRLVAMWRLARTHERVGGGVVVRRSALSQRLKGLEGKIIIRALL